MAMCSSGQIAILSAPQAGCSSISQSVEGNATPPKCLQQLGIDAGMTAPIKMSCFYGYAVTKKISLCSISSTADGLTNTCACLCIKSAPTMIAGECYCITICGSLNTVIQGTTSCAYLCITCNGTSKYSCAIAGNACTAAICKPFVINYGEDYNVIIYAQTANTACSSCACATGYISSISNISGNFGLGTPSTCSKNTG